VHVAHRPVGNAMKRLAPLFLLALLLAPHVSLAAQPRITIEVRIGPDGWGVAVLHPPPGVSYRVVAVEGDTPGPGWSGAAARPLLYALLPDPRLWRSLERLPVVPSPAATTPRPVTVSGSGVFVAAVPGEPGGTVRLVLEPVASQSPGGGGKPLMVIVVPSGDIVARTYAEKIARLHSGDMRVLVLTTSEVAARYPEAPEPPGACKPGRDGAPKYNLSLALHIIGMERELLGKGLRYLLLIGGAREVPPVYYCSPILSELVSPKEGKVPSDYFYADPDYDGVAEVAVGRIPFTDALGLAAYYNALKTWMKGGDWQRYALVTGGAPFATTLFVGEAAASMAAAEMRAMNMSVDSFLLSEANYRGLRLAGYLGRYGLYYIVAHGSGDSLLDYIPGGLWNYDFQELLRSSEVAAGGKPGVYVMPACRDGYWDTDLVEPPFQPPSLGVALLEKGVGVAYAGYARVAVEVIDGVSGLSGRLSVSMAGADRLLLMFIKSLGEAATIGDAWREALTAYLALPSSHYRAYLANGEEDIGVLVTRSAVLLGDPAAPSPWRSRGSAPKAPLAAVPGSVSIGAAYVASTLAKYAVGTVPAVNPGAEGTFALDLRGACPGNVHAWGLRKVLGTTLIGMEELNVSVVETGGGGCRLLVHVPPGAPSLVRITGLVNETPVAYYVVAAGAYVDEKRGVLVLRGLDALDLVGDEPLLLQVGNVTVATLQGGSTSAAIPLSRLARLAGSGGAVVRLVPLYASASIYGGPRVAADEPKLLKLFTINVTMPQSSLGAPMNYGGARGGAGGAAAPASGEPAVAPERGGAATAPMPLLELPRGVVAVALVVSVLGAAAVYAAVALTRGRTASA